MAKYTRFINWKTIIRCQFYPKLIYGIKQNTSRIFFGIDDPVLKFILKNKSID